MEPSLVGYEVARSPDEAVAAAGRIGYPAVLKVLPEEVVHKTDVGGVATDLRTAGELREAYDDIRDRVQSARPDATLEGMLVERFVQGGRETIVGMTTHRGFGPVLMFGLGGIYVEALQDVAFRIQPHHGAARRGADGAARRGAPEVDAREMVSSIRGYRLLEGVRGEPPADVDALVEAIQRVFQLVGDHHRIAELDINPFLVFEEGACAVDARVRIGEEASGPPVTVDEEPAAVSGVGG